MDEPEITTTDSDPTRSYVVFGATGGIGERLCRRLSSHGARLVIAGRTSDSLQRLADELDATAYPLDATRFEEVQACVAKAVELHGRVDGVANCVGSLILKPAHLTSEGEWLSTVATNLTTAFAVVRAGAKAMLNSGGSIVIVSSAAARIGLTNHEAIAAAKAGVIGLTLSAAATYGLRGIRVNCVAPGLVRTPLTARLTANEVSLKASTAMHALGRIGQPDDVAAAIEWLLSPQQSWVTGQVLGIDGGLGSIRSR
jgi:NAD(P)-dependent dehydrogenase (short-subunit alcohol dehydrogenase family)